MKTKLQPELDHQTKFFNLATNPNQPGYCRRCNGLMVREDCFDLLDSQIELAALRCIQCGDLVDPVILRNRSNPSTALAKRHGKWSSFKGDASRTQ